MPDEDSVSPTVRRYRDLLRVTERLHPRGLFHIPGLREKVVALTIDDGPSSRTWEILDLLQRFDARATFFLHTDRITRATGGLAIVERIAGEGHDIANHMPDHRVSIGMTAQEFDVEFERAHEVLAGAGPEPKFFRAAGGFFHVDRMLPSLKRLDYFDRFIMASYLPWDTHFPFPRQYALHLAKGAFPGAIFVLHEGDESPKRMTRTIETMRHLLKRLRMQGYRIEPLSYLLRLTAPKEVS